MFVGHLAAGLAAKRIEPQLNLGTIFVAVLFADLLLWGLVLAGVERVIVPPDFAAKHYFTFEFPYSHGLASSLAWAALAGLAAFALTAAVPARNRIAIVIACAVLSHFLLDVVVHVPELPIAGPASPKLGLGLWTVMPAALALELGLAGLALAWYLRGPATTIRRKPLVAGLIVLVAALTAVGPYLDTQVPEAAVLATSSLVTLGIVVLAGFWAEGKASVCVDHAVTRAVSRAVAR